MTQAPRGPVHVTGEVLASKRVGAYRHLTLVAPGIPERFRPGTFVALSAGPGRIARRAMWIHRIKPTGGYGATIELVVEPVGPGTEWLVGLPVGARLEVTGPLGRPWAMPKESVAASWSARGTPPPRSSRWPSGCASASARSPSSSPAPTRRTCCPPWRPGARPAPSPSSPATGRSDATEPWPT